MHLLVTGQREARATQPGQQAKTRRPKAQTEVSVTPVRIRSRKYLCQYTVYGYGTSMIPDTVYGTYGRYGSSSAGTVQVGLLLCGHLLAFICPTNKTAKKKISL